MKPNIHLGGRALAAILSAALLALVGAGPALADAEQGHTGTVGFHALRDSSQKGGAVCRYKGIEPSPGGYSYEGKLTWIDVRPPKVRAISGSQQVGWRFFVERRKYESSGWSPWAVTYRSPVQRDVTNASTNASFSMMGINVRVPSSGADDDAYEYRVQVKMFWYRANGRTQGTATHLVEWYKSVYNNWPLGNGVATYVDQYPCWGWVGIEIM